MKKVKIGLIGFGTVGTGVVKLLKRNKELIAEKTGVLPVIEKIADLDITTDRGVEIPDGILTTNINDVLNNPDIDVVIELVGGTTYARDFVEKALKNGKAVVTANKALLADCGEDLFNLAYEKSLDFYYEASVAGGIPIIKALRESLSSNNINTVYGILNGTCNYILSRMEDEGTAFDEILKDAQKAGYAEADPTFDIDGIDTAHKTIVLASLAFGNWFNMDDVHVEGIRGIDLLDFKYAAKLGYRIKLLSIIKNTSDGIEMSVRPTLVPADSLIGSVHGVYNCVWINSDWLGNSMYYGQGAGEKATASAVVSDVIDIALNLKNNASNRIPAFTKGTRFKGLLGEENSRGRFYLRIQLANRPGVFGEIATVFGEYGISLASVDQKEIDQNKKMAQVVVLTHDANQNSLNSALEKIRQFDEAGKNIVVFKIEDFE
ncbi:MAG: homoserine dehydrogenase [Verrucomicrobiota bacterium]|nr:homoserine dehydrogenase [Verrucomicrobiota bacterium]